LSTDNVKPILLVLTVLLLSVLAVFITSLYFFPYSIRLFSTLLAVVVTYAVKFFLDRWVARKFVDRRVQFSFRRIVNVFAFIAAFIAVLAIWVQDATVLFVSTGIIGAGVAIALQDAFRNLAGGLIVLFNRTYRIGDRIEVDGKYGDVLDIGLFNTTLLEIQEWVDGDQATGRLTSVPNAFVLSKQFNNYSKDYAFLWDEISLPVTYDSDWKAAYSLINRIVEEETLETIKNADQALKRLGEKYYFTKRSPAAATYLTLTDNWINFQIRYTSEVKNRRTLNSRISRRILEEIESAGNITIASTTLSVSGKIGLDSKQ